MKNPINFYSNIKTFNNNNNILNVNNTKAPDDKKLAIAWVDLTYKVKSIWRKRSKVILDDVNGSVSFGTLNALMGPSGAGKTTLMKCINGKLKSGLSHRSKIYLSAHEKIQSCLIGQNQNQQLITGLTARQNLLYASKLKNSDNAFVVDHRLNVDSLLSELMSKQDMANTNVENCSGGEQRRITIALELTSYIKPNLICIDEPTSGLDSNAAEMVIEYLRLLSRKHNISIITSIHQPNSDSLMMFDKLYVLAKGGVCVYSGPPKTLGSHLNHCQIECTEFQFPIEVLLKIATKGAADRQVLRLAKKATDDNKPALAVRCASDAKLYPNGIPFRTKCFNMYDMWYLLLRTMTYSYVSHWRTLLIQCLFYILCPLIIAKTVNHNIGAPDGCFEYSFRTNKSCFNQLEDDSLLDQNIKYQAFTSVLVMFIQICTTTLTFTSDVKIFMNEHQNKWYSTGSYYLAKNIVELLPTIIFSIAYASLNYYISGQLLEESRLLSYVFVIIFGMLCAQGMGYLIGIICIRSEQIAIGVAIGLYLMLCMFCNIFTPLKEMPQIFVIISDISFNKFVFYNVLTIIYGFGRCPAGQLSIVLHKIDIKDDNLFYTYGKYLVIYAISLRILAFVVLYVKVNTFVNRSWLLKARNVVKKLQCFHAYLVQQSEPELLNVRKISTVSNKSVYYIDCEDINHRDFDHIHSERKLSIAWTDLTLKSGRQLLTKEKTILSQLSGCIEMGTLTALMGPSGAGKTSLLKCLNGRNQSLMTDESKIYLSKYRKIKTCFISQDVSEHLISGLTAKQALIYASKLKNGADKRVDHVLSAENLMIDLLISDIADSNVQNCSTGEQKRLVMAMELTSLHKPNLICIDEPTTGLDSNAAEVVMKCLKVLSRKHDISIITSIHQPNSDVLMMFDKLYVLANGGVCVYSGVPQQLKQHLYDCGIQCSELQVPIELLLKHAYNGCEDTYVQKLMAMADVERQCLMNRCRTETVLCPEGLVTKSKRFSLKDFWYLLARIITYTYRYNWKLILLKAVVSLTFGYCLTLFFSDAIGQVDSCVAFDDDFGQNNCQKTAQQLADESLLGQNISFNFLVILLITFIQIVVTTMTFSLDVKIFLNEHRNGWYSTGCYYWAKSIEELIPTLITLFLYICVIYKYDDNWLFVHYVYLLLVGILSIQSLGHMIAIAMSDNQKLAILSSVTLYLLFFLLSNFFVPIKELHYSIQWFSDLSTFKLLFECLLILMYGFDRCSGERFSSVMFIFGFSDGQFYSNTRLLLIKMVALRVLALIMLLVKVNLIVGHKRRAVCAKPVATTESSSPSSSTVKESKIFIP